MSPPWLQREASQQAHALENACGLINSISEGKTRLHPSHVVQENSLETCRQTAYKPPLGRMLLKTCDRKCVVDPDVVEHWAGFRSALFAPQEMHLDPKSHGECGIQKSSHLGSEICHQDANITFNPSLCRVNCQLWDYSVKQSSQTYPNPNKLVKIHCTIGLETVLIAYNQKLGADFGTRF